VLLIIHLGIERKRDFMNGKIFRKTMCVILSLMMFGCNSAYNLTLYSQPSGIAVEVSPEIQGRTPCNLSIPYDSDLIKHHNLDVKYILDDGREIVRSYDMRMYEPPGPDIGGFIGGCIAFPGMLLLSILGSDKDDDCDCDDKPFFYKVDKEEEKRKEKAEKEDRKAGLVGLGLVVTGALISGVFGNHNSKRKYNYDIHETFEYVNDSPND